VGRPPNCKHDPLASPPGQAARRRSSQPPGRYGPRHRRCTASPTHLFDPLVGLPALLRCEAGPAPGQPGPRRSRLRGSHRCQGRHAGTPLGHAAAAARPRPRPEPRGRPHVEVARCPGPAAPSPSAAPVMTPPSRPPRFATLLSELSRQTSRKPKLSKGWWAKSTSNPTPYTWLVPFHFAPR
jgi:hypothetical protein